MLPPTCTALYTTPWGQAYVGDSLDLLPLLPPDSLDLLLTSPPFPLQRQKEYGNHTKDTYINWLLQFGPLIRRVLKPTGSFVLDLGGTYQQGRPIRSLYNYEILLRLCHDHGFYLAQEFFWHNPARLPSPIEWVNKRKIRVKDSVNTVWWLAKTDKPKADVRRVLLPYSSRMHTLLKDPERFYTAKKRPSGHYISYNFANGNSGAIPSNLLSIANTESNSAYLRYCRALGIKPHPARFPEKLPEFFIKLLTDPGDLVLDIFAGSNTTGYVAEKLGRRWLAMEINRNYLIASVLRFADKWTIGEATTIIQQLHLSDASVSVSSTRECDLFARG
jgi:DNA modification methylase